MIKIRVDGQVVHLPTLKGVDGKSAYQYAVDAGFKGTEQEFINLLIEGTDVINSHLTDIGAHKDIRDIITDLDKYISGMRQTVGLMNDNTNLIPFPYYDTRTEVDGVTFDIDSEGRITLNGTATKGIYFYLMDKTYDTATELPDNEKFIISGCPSGGSANTYKLSIVKNVNGTRTSLVDDYGNGAEFTAVNDGSTKYDATINIKSGTVLENVVFEPMIRLARIKDNTFKPYMPNLIALINKKADKDSPVFTGTPEAPTAEYGNNTTQIATTEFVQTAVKEGLADLVDGAPDTMDTLKEVSDAIKAHKDVTDALNAAIGNKVDKVTGKGLSTNDFTDEYRDKLDGIAEGGSDYILPVASNTTLGGVKTTSNVSSSTGLTACPIIEGVPYYKDAGSNIDAATLSGKSLLRYDATDTWEGIPYISSRGIMEVGGRIDFHITDGNANDYDARIIATADGFSLSGITTAKLQAPVQISDNRGILKTVIGLHNPIINTEIAAEENGSELTFTGGGNTFVGGGESPFTIRNSLISIKEAGTGTAVDETTYDPIGEQMYLASDSHLWLYSNANIYEDRKCILFNREGQFIPFIDNKYVLGRPDYRWANISAAKINNYTLGDACARGVKTLTGKGPAGYGTNNDYLPDITFISRWDGRYNNEADTNSNLSYCNKGAFGDVVTKGILNNTAKGALGYVVSTAPNLVPTVSTIAWWDGAYKGTNSNLAYCVKGAFGDAAIKGVDTTVTKDSNNLATSGAVYTAIEEKMSNINVSDASTLNGKSLLTKNSTDTWDAIPYISNTGVIELGKYIDFHTTDENTSNYDVRVEATTEGLILGGKTNLVIKAPLKMVDDAGIEKSIIGLHNPTPDAPVSTGSDLVMTSGGNVFIGGGESSTSLRNALNAAPEDSTILDESIFEPLGEQMFLSSDAHLWLYSNCNDIANRKAIVFNRDGVLLPYITNSYNLGTNDYSWNSIYVNTLNSALETTTYLAGNQGRALINSNAPAGTYTALSKLNSTNGYFCDVVFGKNRYLMYTSKETVDAGLNEATYKAALLTEEGNTLLPGLLTTYGGIKTTTVNNYILGDACARGVKTLTGRGPSGIGTNNDYLTDVAFISRWDGRYDNEADTNSNLLYCNKGKFGDAATKNVLNNTAKGALGYVATTAQNQVPTVTTIAYWDGAYKGTISNLAYCVKGEFGDAAIKGVDTTVTNGSANLITSGAMYTELANKLGKTDNAASATKVYSKTATFSGDYYRIPFHSNDVTNGNASLVNDAGFLVRMKTGKAKTDSTNAVDGFVCLSLGNTIASGVDGNTYGAINIYGNTSYRTQITAGSPTQNRNITLPDAAGTIALTTSNVASATNASNATKVYGTLTNPTEHTIYCPTFHTGGSDGNKSLLHNDGLIYASLEGTVNAEGYGILTLGNSKAKGTDKNKYGAILLYGSGTKSTTLQAPNSTANRTITFPDASGTVALVNSSGNVMLESGSSYCIKDKDGNSRKVATFGYDNIVNLHSYSYATGDVDNQVVIGTHERTNTAQVRVKNRIDFLIGTETNDDPAITIINADGSIILRPTVNDGAKLGSSAMRWGQIYTTAAVNVSSDKRIKNTIEDISDKYIKLWDKLSPKSYYLNSDNDNPNKKKHLGFIANDVAEAAESVGLELEDCGFVDKQWVEREDYTGFEYSLRYDELFVLTHAKVKEQQTQIDNLMEENHELRSEIDTLKSELTELKELVSKLLNK